jgi:hypothetical protein
MLKKITFRSAPFILVSSPESGRRIQSQRLSLRSKSLRGVQKIENAPESHHA